MICKLCNSTNVVKNGTGTLASGEKYQKVKCQDCGKETSNPMEDSKLVEVRPKIKIGISLDEFRQRHDLNFILKNVLQNLNGGLIYEKDDIIKLCKLRPGYPGLNTVLESGEFEQYRGRIAGKVYWSAPKIIEELKSQGLLT